MNLKRFLLICLELLFPPHCIFCGRVIAPGKKICAHCAAEITPANAVRCMKLPVCGKNMRCVILYFYRDQVRKSMIQFKFYGRKEYSDFYAERLAALISRRIQPLSLDLVTAVPISEKRKNDRGFNQSELLARHIAKQLNLPYAETLVKVRDNPEQHRLSRRERVKNVHGVYRALHQEIGGRQILLIDDILTTGSTLLECAEVLYQGGARCVDCAAVAQAEMESG